MIIVADSSAFLAVALGKPERPRLIEITKRQELSAPEVLPYELGNALTAMLRRGTLERHEVLSAWDALQTIQVTLRPVDLRSALDLAAQFGVYAYDAYFLECALQLRAPILTLDKQMIRIARELSIPVLE
jgi:predicted nucleic acid-binding protein